MRKANRFREVLVADGVPCGAGSGEGLPSIDAQTFPKGVAEPPCDPEEA